MTGIIIMVINDEPKLLRYMTALDDYDNKSITSGISQHTNKISHRTKIFHRITKCTSKFTNTKKY